MRLLRIDDLGASSKQYEQYSRRRWANVGFLKRMPGLKAWGPYPELDPMILEMILAAVDAAGSHLHLAVTAAWLERDSRLTPFAAKYPSQAATIRRWRDRGVCTIVSHGLTHAVPGRHLPRFWTWNRRWHREFVPELPMRDQVAHLIVSQKLFADWLGEPPTLLVPPANLISDELVARLPEFGLQLWPREPKTLAFHDRDFLLGGFWESFQVLLQQEVFGPIRGVARPGGAWYGQAGYGTAGSGQAWQGSS